MGTLTLAALATLVFCAPGYPGGSGDAQPFVDQFAKAAAASAGWKSESLAAIYAPTEQGGLAKLSDKGSVPAFVPFAFYVQHAAALHLTPLKSEGHEGEHGVLVAQFRKPTLLSGVIDGRKTVRLPTRGSRGGLGKLIHEGLRVAGSARVAGGTKNQGRQCSQREGAHGDRLSLRHDE